MGTVVLTIGPAAVEPTENLRRFSKRDEYPSLMAYWLSIHTNKYIWRYLFDRLRTEMDRYGAERGVIYVPGIGSIGGTSLISTKELE